MVDLGGGSGWFVLYLTECNEGDRPNDKLKLVSIDMVPRIVSGKERVSHIKGSVLDVPVRSNSADFVGANAILHHVPDQLDICISEVHRILKPGGRFLAQEPLAGNPPANWTRQWVKTSAHEEGERPLSFEAMEKAILGQGLKIENVEFFFLTSYLMPHLVPLAPKGMRGILRWKGKFLVRMDRKLLRKLPGLSKYAAYVSIVATKD